MPNGGVWRTMDVEDRRLDPRVLWRLVSYTLPHRWLVLSSVAILLGVSMVELVAPIIMRHAVDGPMARAQEALRAGEVAPAEELRSFAFLLGGFAVLVVVQLVMAYLQIYVTMLTGQRVMYQLRQQLFAHLQRLELGFWNRNPVGALVTRVTSDVESLSEMFSSGVAAVFYNLAKAIFILVILFFLNLPMALLCLALVPPMTLGSWAFARAARIAFRRMRGALTRLNAFLQESLSGIRITRLFGAQQVMVDEFRRRNDTLCEAHLGTVRVYALMFPVVTMLSATAVTGVLYLGAHEAQADRLTMGQLLQFWFYLNFFFDPVRELAERWNVLQSAAASAERVFGVLDTEPAVQDQPQARRPEALVGEIEFDDVHFSYRPGEPVLRGVSFRVAPGEHVAVVGATGAGKSTLVSLLCRFHDVSAGAIRIDGVDLREYEQRALRDRIALVLQDVFLFTGTVRGNILLGRSELSEQALHRAASVVHADTFVEGLPEGYDSSITERGSNLSAGERQLLAFARAFARDPAILILDEATSSIDTRTEALIQDAVSHLMEGRTAVVIAHRLSTIRDCDRILVMHHGRLREEGTHEELLALDGIYARLHQLQFVDAPRPPTPQDPDPAQRAAP